MRESIESQKGALEMAKDAASRKDATSFLRCLHESGFMAGAKLRLRDKYSGKFDNEKTHEILTVAADKFYEAIAGGRKILYPGSYLWKTVDNMALDICRAEVDFFSIEEADAKGELVPYNRKEATTYKESDEDDDDNRRREKGIEIARSLLPKIGSDNVQKVMEYIINAVEEGVEDLANKEISEALGLSEESIRKWKQRGFERLKRAAIETGYRKEFLRDIETDSTEDEDLSGA